MTPQPAPERWRRVEALFYEALERHPASRDAFLQQACAGDAVLRREVEELLAHTDVTLAEIRQPVDEAVRQFSPHGQQIGPFRLVRLLGEGGMGAVYLAERADDEYRQQVAIKLMRAGLGHDSEMLRRFRAERQILADLNHPYIARLLHGGTTPQGSPYLVMEYIDGAAIDRYCAARDLSVDDRLRLFLKVCAAVEYAHLNHVIHRDLKPANILVTAGGEPKLLDFGIAKLLEPESGETGRGATRHTGRLMTPEYASPEQVRGEPVTVASDIYSLGTVLYELVAGKHPFASENASPLELGRLICETQPEPPSRVARSRAARPSSISARLFPALDRIVLTAMRKDPRERYASAAEFADSVRAYLDGRPSRPPTGTGSTLAHALAWSGPKLTLAALAMVAVLGAVAAALYLAIRPNPAATPFNSMHMSRMTTRGNVAEAAISADGRFVAYIVDEDGHQSLWMTQLATASDLRMVGPETGSHTSLAFSADGNYLYYLREVGDSSNTLYRLPILGGEPRPVHAPVGNSIALAPDGKRYAFLRVDSLHGEAALAVANLDGTGAQTIAVRHRPEYFARYGLAWSPDGQNIACFAGNASFYTPQAFRIVAIHVPDGREKPLTGRAWADYDSIAWLEDGHSLVASASDQFYEGYQVWHAGYPGGEVRRVTNDLGNYEHVGITADGKTMVAVSTESSGDLWVAPAGNPARAVPVSPLGLRGITTLAWDSQGGILYSALAGDSRNIWHLDANGAPARQLTSGPGYKDEIAATPDGRYILHSSDGKIWRTDASGDQPRQLTHGALDVHPFASPDSRWVIYGSFPEWSPAIGGKPTIWKVPIEGGEPIQLTRQASSMPQVSPDGKLIAYLTLPEDNPLSPSSAISVAPFDGGPPLCSFDIPSQTVRWAPDGKSLLYRKTDHGVGNIWRQPIYGGQPAQLTTFAAEDILDFAVSRDGRLAIARGRSLSDVVLIRGFR